MGYVCGKNSLRDSRGELLSINANTGTRGCEVFQRNAKVQKPPKHDFWTYWSVLGAFVAKTHFVIRTANFVLPYIGSRGCEVFHRNAKVQKPPKLDFWTYESVLGAFVAKSHFVILVANFCQLMPILAYIGTRGWEIFHRNAKVQKPPKHDFWTYWSVLGAFVAKNHFVIRAANFCQLCQYWHILAHVGAKFFTGMQKFKNHKNMILRHIGVYWVCS